MTGGGGPRRPGWLLIEVTKTRNMAYTGRYHSLILLPEGDSAVNASSWFRRNHDTFWCTLKWKNASWGGQPWCRIA